MKSKYEEILVNGKRYLKHRYVWEQHNGKIPDGYEVHHRDLNTHNNDIFNLWKENSCPMYRIKQEV